MLQQEGIGLIYKIKYTTRSLNPRRECKIKRNQMDQENRKGENYNGKSYGA